MATVSYVLNGRAEELHVDPETKEKVEKAAGELGYRLRPSVGRGGKQIGVLFPNVNGDYMAQLLTGIQDVLREYDYHALFSLCGDDPKSEQADMRMCLRRRAAGIITFPCEDSEASRRWADFLPGAPPVVFIGRKPPDIANADCVCIDNSHVGSEAADILLREGCRTFLLVRDDTVDPLVLEPRRTGFIQRLREQGLPPPRELVWRDYASIITYLEQAPPSCGIFAVRDELILPAFYLAGQRGVSIPSDLALASVGRVEGAHPLSNRCWIAEHPTREMGRLAARQLLYRIGEIITPPSMLLFQMNWKSNLMLEQHLRANVNS